MTLQLLRTLFYMFLTRLLELKGTPIIYGWDCKLQNKGIKDGVKE